jgi:hypothetical protein
MYALEGFVCTEKEGERERRRGGEERERGGERERGSERTVMVISSNLDERIIVHSHNRLENAKVCGKGSASLREGGSGGNTYSRIAHAWPLRLPERHTRTTSHGAEDTEDGNESGTS